MTTTDDRLPGRMGAIVSLLPESARTVVDIGYDHGLLIREVLRARPRALVIGVEIQEGASSRVHRRARRERWEGWERAELRRGDGLGPIALGEADVVVLAGMGERSILRVLGWGRRQLLEVDALVVMPAEIPIRINAGLERLGWRIDDAAVALEKGRYYIALRAGRSDRKGACSGRCLDAPSSFFAPLVARRAPELYDYLMDIRGRLRKSIEHLEKQSGPVKAFCASLDEEIRGARCFRQQDICVEQEGARRLP